MDKDKINSKIEDLEAELQKLKKLANEPEKREPEAGGVWQGFSGSDWLVGESRATIEPHRGKPNEPAYLADIAKRCAEALAMTPDELAAHTTNNTKAFFNLS